MSTGVELAAPPARTVAALERELQWLDRVLQARLCLHFGQPCEVRDVRELTPPAPLGEDPFARFLRSTPCSFDERLVLVLALAPHVRPQLLDTLFVRNRNLDRGYTEFGGWKGKSHGGFLPTCETAVFLLAGEDLPRRFAATALFDDTHWFQRRGVLRVEHDAPGEPPLAAALLLQPEFRELLTTGLAHKPDFSAGFPARLITTALGWNDLVLAPEVMDEIEAINTWLAHADELLQGWGLAKSVKPGYRSLFFGPPGTGKTLTATLIGQKARADVYRIDLSMVVSKYIGETEKNLARVFDLAQNRRWILFFDEADALFGKRTGTSSSNDRYANQEVSYLLQRVEDFPGTVILATNLKANIDEAFARRFQSLVHFPMPDADQRLQLWQGMAGATGRLEKGLDLAALAQDHELSGGAIANVLRAAAIQALRGPRQTMTRADLLMGIAKEMRKEGRTV
jgi:hypothetical protein